MGRRRQGLVVLGVLLAGVVAGCGSSGDPSGEGSWTERPRPGSGTAAGAAADGSGAATDGGRDAAPRPEPPELPLCTLSGPPVTAPGDVLIYGDDFTGNVVDPLKWSVRDGYKGHGTISNTVSPANAVVRDGSLFIVTERAPADPVHPYVSGWIDTISKFARTYGKIEFRARLSFSPGVWSALWGRPWSQPFPEIDIELLNRSSKTAPQLYFVNHWAAPPLPAAERRAFVLIEDDDFTRFHSYAVLWKPNLLEYSVDGVTKMQRTGQGVPDLPVQWIINSWVGGWSGEPTAATRFPHWLEVDHVHVYRVDGLIADPVLKIANPRAQYGSSEAIEVMAANFDEACAHVAMYDGDRLVKTMSTAPFRFRLSALAPGQHRISFVATDGVRSTTTSIDSRID